MATLPSSVYKIYRTFLSRTIVLHVSVHFFSLETDLFHYLLYTVKNNHQFIATHSIMVHTTPFKLQLQVERQFFFNFQRF